MAEGTAIETGKAKKVMAKGGGRVYEVEDVDGEEESPRRSSRRQS